jgi:hypothetical protein
MRIPLGVDAVEMIKLDIKNVLEEIERYEDIGKSCLADDANAADVAAVAKAAKA